MATKDDAHSSNRGGDKDPRRCYKAYSREDLQRAVEALQDPGDGRCMRQIARHFGVPSSTLLVDIVLWSIRLFVFAWTSIKQPLNPPRRFASGVQSLYVTKMVNGIPRKEAAHGHLSVNSSS